MVTSYPRPLVIAEIGCNHKGEFDTALELIRLAKECGAYAAKFQKRDPKMLLTEEQYNSPHPNPYHAYGTSYGEHREYLEFSLEQHAELKKYAESLDLVYSTSVWEEKSAEEIITLDPLFLKIPSACNNNFSMLEILRDTYKGEIHVSFGMTTTQEQDQVVEFFEVGGHARSRLVVYSCTSGYPVAFEDVCLMEITRLKERYGNRVKEVGFSGHHLGIAIDIAAYALGAIWIERHFTKDRTWRGTDHAASLEPQGLRNLVRNLEATHQAMSYKKKEILDVEDVQRKKLKYQK